MTAEFHRYGDDGITLEGVTWMGGSLYRKTITEVEKIEVGDPGERGEWRLSRKDDHKVIPDDCTSD
jgi:hypothetical protein